MKHLLTTTTTVLLTGVMALLPAVSATAAYPVTHHYSSCAAVHRSYSGGISKRGVYYNTIRHADGTVTRRPLRGRVLHSTTAYTVNRGLDRDHDSVACEI